MRAASKRVNALCKQTHSGTFAAASQARRLFEFGALLHARSWAWDGIQPSVASVQIAADAALTYFSRRKPVGSLTFTHAPHECRQAACRVAKAKAHSAQIVSRNARRPPSLSNHCKSEASHLGQSELLFRHLNFRAPFVRAIFIFVRYFLSKLLRGASSGRPNPERDVFFVLFKRARFLMPVIFFALSVPLRSCSSSV